MSNMAKWGVCTGQQLPTSEICNGLDDDCDGVVDNGVPAPTPGQVTGGECCGDKAPGSKCGQGQCQKGTWVCAGTVVVCANAGAPSNETCDNQDNDCDGVVDNIITVGGPCVAPGGCSGTLKCDSAQQQLVCQPDGSAGVEKCDGIDNDCDGKTDEVEDVSVNDDWWHDACDAPPEGHDKPPCKAGQFVCKNGAKVCEGAVGPLPEVCDLKDTDCDGVSDTLAACPGSNACVQGVCVEPCHGGEFPCPGGYECQSFDNKKYCVPTTCNDVECPPGASCKNGQCTLDNAGGAGNAGGASSGEGGDTSMTNGGAGNTEGGDGQGAGTAGKSFGTAANGTGANGTGATGTGTPSADAHGKFGLVTGGGGCACRTVPSKNGQWAALASLLALGAVLTRRRRRSTRRAA
jgi:MYXO-CTERM domain-containing protein